MIPLKGYLQHIVNRVSNVQTVMLKDGSKIIVEFKDDDLTIHEDAANSPMGDIHLVIIKNSDDIGADEAKSACSRSGLDVTILAGKEISEAKRLMPPTVKFKDLATQEILKRRIRLEVEGITNKTA